MSHSKQTTNASFGHECDHESFPVSHWLFSAWPIQATYLFISCRRFRLTKFVFVQYRLFHLPRITFSPYSALCLSHMKLPAPLMSPTHTPSPGSVGSLWSMHCSLLCTLMQIACPGVHLPFLLRRDLIFTTASASPQPQCLLRSWPSKGAQQILRNLHWRERKGLGNPWNVPTAVTSALHSLVINPVSLASNTPKPVSVLRVKGDNTYNSTIAFIFRELRVTWCGKHPFLGYFPKSKHNDSTSPCNPLKVRLNPNENYSYNILNKHKQRAVGSLWNKVEAPRVTPWFCCFF